jgi:digeranylgeranylglycerophospholipid reductase
MKMKKVFDLIVVGAGVGGCVLAKKASEAGFEVALIDKKPMNYIGYGWEVACEKKIFGRVSLKFPDATILSGSPDYYRFSAIKQQHGVEMNALYDSVFYAVHKKLNQDMLAKAAGSGVTILDRFDVAEYIHDNGKIKIITGWMKSLFGERKVKLRARIVADASGSERAIARQLPEEALVQHQIQRYDLVSAWNEVCEIDPYQTDRIMNTFGIRSGMYSTNIGPYHAYQAIFLRKNNTVSITFGASVEFEKRSARIICSDFKKKYPFFGKVISGGGKIIPIRRSIDNMVADGFLCLGDSACQVVPTMGSGISSSMYAADIAASVITESLNSGDTSTASLWKYNVNYQTRRGAILASYDVIRRFLQNLPIAETEKIFENGLLQDENFIQIYAADRLVYNLSQIVDNVGKIITNPIMLPTGLHMAGVLRDSEKVLHLYQNYPKEWDKKALFNWMFQINKIFKKPVYFSEFSIDSKDFKSINFF